MKYNVIIKYSRPFDKPFESTTMEDNEAIRVDITSKLNINETLFKTYPDTLGIFWGSKLAPLDNATGIVIKIHVRTF